MAANPTMPNTFTNGTASDAAQVNANFATLTAWIAANAAQIDGSVAFSGTPSGPAADPTTANQLARKQYVDQRLARVLLSKTDTSFAVQTALTGMTEDEDLNGMYAGGTDITIPAGQTGMYVVDLEVTTPAGYVGGLSTAMTVTIYLGSTSFLGVSFMAAGAQTKRINITYWLTAGDVMTVKSVSAAADAPLSYIYKLRLVRVG